MLLCSEGALREDLSKGAIDLSELWVSILPGRLIFVLLLELSVHFLTNVEQLSLIVSGQADLAFEIVGF